MIVYVHCPSEYFEGIYNGSDVSGWRCGCKVKAFGEHGLKWLWYLVICDVDNEVLVGVVIDGLSVMFFLLVFAADSSV